MQIIKPEKQKKPCTLEADDDFYKYTHAFNVSGMVDYSLCGVGSEEFGDYKIAKKITCPDCLGIIRDCKSYKL
jgi:hypothetical protein